MSTIGTAAGLVALVAQKNTHPAQSWVVPRDKWLCTKAYDRNEAAQLVYYLEGWEQSDLTDALREGKFSRKGNIFVGGVRFFKGGNNIKEYFKGHVSALGVARMQCIIKQRHWWALGDRDCAVAPTLSVAQQWSPRSSVLLEGEAPCNYFVTDDAAVLREEQDRSSKAAVAATKGGRSSLRTAPRTHIKQGGHSGKGRRASSSSSAAAAHVHTGSGCCERKEYITPIAGPRGAQTRNAAAWYAHGLEDGAASEVATGGGKRRRTKEAIDTRTAG